MIPEMVNMSISKRFIGSIIIILLVVTVLLFSNVTTASAASAVRNTDVTTATSGNTLVSYEGDFLYVSANTILDRLNAIRYEACAEGVYGLSMSDYVPLRWSSELEWIAQTRAAEAAMYHSHIRPNGKDAETLKYYRVATENEALYWGGSVDIMRAIEGWYSEKFDDGDTSHYRAIIDPNKKQVAIGAFKPTSGWGAVAAEFTSRGDLYEGQTGASGRFSQILEVSSSGLSIGSLSAPDKVHIGIPAQCTVYGTANFSSSSSVTFIGNFSWSSSNTSIATVDASGSVIGVNAGTATISATFRGVKVSDTVQVEGHNWNSYVVDKEPTCVEEGSGHVCCSYCGVEKTGSDYSIDKIPHPYGEWETRIAATCDSPGSRKKTCLICRDTIVEVVPAQGHDWDRWIVTKRATTTEEGIETRVCKRDSSHVETRTIPVKTSDEVSLERIYGDTRYETSLNVADKLKEQLGIEKFDSVILTNGNYYADALAGSYLSSVRKAPILLVDTRQDRIDAVQSYIRENLNENGTIYILGGAAVMPDRVVNGLTGYKISRLWGQDRYETNIAILNEASNYTTDTEILVVSGTGFADSLSAAAVGRPILLVSNSLLNSQKHYLKTQGGGKTFVVIGGTGAVSDRINEELKVFGSTERIWGETRYETSAKVAKRFFDYPETAVLAYGEAFPDGLCGGALAYASGGPMILVADGKTEYAAAFAEESDMNFGKILGGPTMITDRIVNTVFNIGPVSEEETAGEENEDSGTAETVENDISNTETDSTKSDTNNDNDIDNEAETEAVITDSTAETEAVIPDNNAELDDVSSKE